MQKTIGREVSWPAMKVFVIIPAYKCKPQICQVIEKIPFCVDTILVIDDCCPEKTGAHALEMSKDPRVKLIVHNTNQGVGGALITGYKKALESGCDIMVKIDGDGQMNPTLIANFIAPIQYGLADYTKGNRFTQVEHLKEMPLIRLLGNLGLSFINKASSGYWKVLDPTNGYTAIHRSALLGIPLQKIHKRYFFESDLLFRLNLIDAVVVDIPMASIYSDEVSNLKIGKSFFEFTIEHSSNFFKRLIYRYFILDFNMASVQLVMGGLLFLFGFLFGAYHWKRAYELDISTPTGTIMISVVTLLVGIQFLISFIGFDIAREARIPISQLRRGG